MATAPASDEEAELKALRQFAKAAQQATHDIRSPVNLLEVGLARQTSDRALLLHAARQIRKILEDLVPIQQQLTKRPRSVGGNLVPMKRVLENVVAQKRVEYEGRNATFLCVIGTDCEPLYVTIPESELCRALSNLLNNALEASGDGATIRSSIVKTPWGIRIDVDDDGPGIPKELRHKVLQRGVTLGKAGGNGLGLHQVAMMCEAYEGAVTISRSELGGACVSLHLPVTPG